MSYYYENTYYCQKCDFMQVETPTTQPIIIPCPKCGCKVFTSTEPNSLELEQFHREQEVLNDEESDAQR